MVGGLTPQRDSNPPYESSIKFTHKQNYVPFQPYANNYIRNGQIVKHFFRKVVTPYFTATCILGVWSARSSDGMKWLFT